MNSISFFKALLMKEIDEELKGGQKKLDVAEPKGKITAADFKALRAKKGVKKEAAPIKQDIYGEDPNLDVYADKDIPGQGMTEGGDHEVSMAHNSLESIIKSAMELKMKLGNDERNIPGWIQDHITNAENYIDQASQGFHELSQDDQESEMDELPVGNEEEPVDDMGLQSIMEALFGEAKKKPSAGLTKKQKSTIAKKAASGKDIGKKGKGFEMIAKKAAKKYGSKERGQAVAAAQMWKSAAKKAK